MRHCRQSPEHEADHGEADEGGGGSSISLGILGEATAPADPGEGALDDPALGQDLEAREGWAFDDFDLPNSRARDGAGHLRALIAAVRVDALDEGEQPTRPAQEIEGAVAVLNVSRMDDDVQKKAERIDEDMALAAFDLLARIKARRIDRGPPFAAPFTLWESMIAVVGLASRLARSRTWT